MATIPGLYATGLGFAVNTQDTNWAFSSISGTCSIPTNGYVADNDEVDILWDESNLDLARWLTPAQNARQNFAAPCSYRCRLTFTIPAGYNAVSATMTIKYEVDDSINIKLNDIQKATGGGLSDWQTAVITGGFVNGTNTLDLEVTNGVNASPTGFRAYFASSYISSKARMFSFSGGLA